MKSVFRRPNLRSQRPKSIFSPPRKSSPCSFLSSSKNLPRSPSSLFHLTPSSSYWGSGQQASSRILVNFVGGVYFSETLLDPYLFGPFLCGKPLLRLELNDPIYHFHQQVVHR
ncbi:hypothetical protein AVEN_73969-1 [Araneus ventricosus]|uniref:Uncharacterized protein n=1 Tax=Araneus ventricosus TaxID=182803 RepID=A0A4Y2L0V7_ARAVE|nr:hypothetical protein AVEN_73969-1 [Araneus ventricosus]